MRLELALMFFHYLNRRRNSNPSPTSTTNPTKNPRSPPILEQLEFHPLSSSPSTGKTLGSTFDFH